MVNYCNLTIIIIEKINFPLGFGGLVKSIILAAKGRTDVHLGNKDATTLDWILPALKNNNITDITLIGGEHIDFYEKKLSNVNILYNYEWETTGMLKSLFHAQNEMDSECLISYADIIYNHDTVKKIIEKGRNGKVSSLSLLIHAGKRDFPIELPDL